MLKQSNLVIIRVMVPVDSADKIRQVLGKAGAGKVGEYSYCSFSHHGNGRFLPSLKANPAIGKKGELTEVEEEMIETICPRDQVRQVIAEMIKIHPYESPAFDIIPRLEI